MCTNSCANKIYASFTALGQSCSTCKEYQDGYRLAGAMYKIGCLKNENNRYCIDAINPSSSSTTSMASSTSMCAGMKEYFSESGCCMMEYLEVIYASIDSSQKQGLMDAYKKSVQDCGVQLAPSCSPTGKEAARLIIEINVLLGRKVCCSAGWDETLFSTAICRDVSTSAGSSAQQCSAEVVAAAQRRGELTDTVTARLTMSSINSKTMAALKTRLASAAANATLPETSLAVKSSARSIGAPKVVSELAPGASAAARANARPWAARLAAVAFTAVALPAARLRALAA